MKDGFLEGLRQIYNQQVLTQMTQMENFINENSLISAATLRQIETDLDSINENISALGMNRAQLEKLINSLQKLSIFITF
jgi:hypothetical protein